MDTHVLLWRAVLRSGLHDVAKGQDPDWMDSDDFTIVCELAEVDADTVRARFDADRFRRLPKMSKAA
ncbi:hypothetical protein [Marivita sp.]|uniref:hypothetical protein n=1 Tax=Marivita sp. TaxID=2003365 RepID=UPI003B5BA612